ncbi:MAG: hypothetical protein GXP29_11920 [Planctomycetes bacterium]|nr:hypothetical protein [Planctomycetota bacterium]
MNPTILLSIALLAPAASQDNNVEWNGITHLASFDRAPLSPVGGESFDVNIQTFDFDVTSVRVTTDGGGSWIDASYAFDRGPYDVWTATLPSSSPTGGFSYYFEITDGTDVDYLGPSGMSDLPPASGWVINFVLNLHAPLGATLTSDGGATFRVWGLNTNTAKVAGEFNGWNSTSLPMTTLPGTGYFTRKVSNVTEGQEYKYIFDGVNWKPDARARQFNPGASYNSVIRDPGTYVWGDSSFSPPPFEEMVIYQLHVGTFSGRNDGGLNRPGTYRDVVDLHLSHLAELGVNVVQLNPITEFPWDWSGGYNPITASAPEAIYGDPDDLKYMVDQLHQAGIAVTLDYVPNHFSGSDNFLWDYTGSQIYFDTPAFDTPWGAQADFDRPEVRSYFVDAALAWIEEYHLDGFRMDGTDFMHPPNGQASGWTVMQEINDAITNRRADKIVYAEQLPDNTYHTRPIADGGAGFDAQYHDRHKYAVRNAIFGAASSNADMTELRETMLGRLNDSGNNYITSSVDGVSQSIGKLIKYFELHDEAWTESGGQRIVKTIDPSFPYNDEFARGRTLIGHGINFFSPGIPAFLMGAEFLEDTDFGSDAPATPEARLDWNKPGTYGNYMQAFKDMIALRRTNPALRSDASYQINHLNDANDVLGLHRWNSSGDVLLIVIGLNNNDLFNYNIGFQQPGAWREIFNSQASEYGGTGLGNGGLITTVNITKDGYANSAFITVPKMSVTVFQWTPEDVNLDGTSDLVDLSLFQQCVGGGPDCSVNADLNGDLTVDANDWQLIGPRVVGPGQ